MSKCGQFGYGHFPRWGIEALKNTIQTNEVRTVETNYLSSRDVTALLEAAKTSRYPIRDRALIILAFRHGLRASEAVGLKWGQIQLKDAKIYVKRLKNSKPTEQDLEHDEVKILRTLQKDSKNEFVFVNERGGPMTRDGFLKMIKRLGEKAGLKGVHPHMLRHGAGHALAEQGVSTRTIQKLLGHVNIQHTVRYTDVTDRALNGLGSLIGGKLD